jgi:ribosome-binding factor A
MRQFKRSQRVGSQMLRDVQSLLEQECAANLEAMVTFTDVSVTDDLRFAKIYYSVLGDEEQKTKTARYFDKVRKRVQSRMGRLLSIKLTPEISFHFDPSIERGMRIEKLLKEISEKDDGKTEENI